VESRKNEPKTVSLWRGCQSGRPDSADPGLGAVAGPGTGGSFLALKAVILLAPLMGILKERLYTYQWSSMFILAFFTEGIMRSWGDHGLSQTLALWKWQSACCSLPACWALPAPSSVNQPRHRLVWQHDKTCRWQVFWFLNGRARGKSI
jgi:hypothetical protein